MALLWQKGEGVFKSGHHQVPTEPLVSTGLRTDEQPPRATADKKTVFLLWFASYWKSIINWISIAEQLLLEIACFWRTQVIGKYLESWLRTPTIITVWFKDVLWPYRVSQCWFITLPQHGHQILTPPVSPDFSRVCTHSPYRKKAGLTRMNQDLYLTPPNSVLEITELGGSKRQPFGMKAFTFFNPYTCFLHTFGGRANFYWNPSMTLSGSYIHLLS